MVIKISIQISQKIKLWRFFQTFNFRCNFDHCYKSLIYKFQNDFQINKMILITSTSKISCIFKKSAYFNKKIIFQSFTEYSAATWDAEGRNSEEWGNNSKSHSSNNSKFCSFHEFYTSRCPSSQFDIFSMKY
jgi:hypothetical protein